MKINKRKTQNFAKNEMSSILSHLFCYLIKTHHHKKRNGHGEKKPERLPST